MKKIKKLKLHNFRKFKNLEIDFDDDLNLLIGDNEAGKSSILTAIDLVLSGSRTKVENIGLENLFNKDIIREFLSSERNNNNLPKLFLELYLDEQNNDRTSGRNNSDNVECDGLRLNIFPNDEYSKYIKDILENPDCVFPFEFYTISFTTFSDISYNSFAKHLKHIFIDNSSMNNEYAMKEYVKDIYNSSLTNTLEKYKHHHQYRHHKEQFKKNVLKDLNDRIGDYNFSLKNNSKSNLDNDLTIYENEISIDNKGKGKQAIIKTELALSRNVQDLDALLIEEPENHLSHVNTRLLIEKIKDSNNKQIFITTHSNLISTRLDLRKSILLNSTDNKAIKLISLPKETAQFFIKAPDNNILEFILARKNILVEGDAEFMLIDKFSQKHLNNNLHRLEINVLSVDGTSFSHYLEIAKLLNIKTCVITDNDGQTKGEMDENFAKYASENIKVYFDVDTERRTFEICLYQDNTALCDKLFITPKRKLSIQDYMLKNKTESAYKLLLDESNIEVPTYIKDALKWISQ
ncbi:ATP-dependent nuclease [Chryseobacterium sp. JV274]|uniref:ATP-dependent nuclease n=1 Tax=Chryseobacterium sp. JV274 TaxID=1932669 RepID=UPI0015C23A25|nr:AAA family ATPase [Chryseobacterium sp. JV274]CAD0221531.1 Putative ATP-dependent endonuclease of OLD family [Chryseobacterium sp. JV274]